MLAVERAALPGAGRGGTGVGASVSAAEQRDRRNPLGSRLKKGDISELL